MDKNDKYQELLPLIEIREYCQTNEPDEVLEFMRSYAFDIFEKYCNYAIVSEKEYFTEYIKYNFDDFYSFRTQIIPLSRKASDKIVSVTTFVTEGVYKYRTDSEGEFFVLNPGNELQFKNLCLMGAHNILTVSYYTGVSNVCNALEADIISGLLKVIKESLAQRDSEKYDGTVLSNSGAIYDWQDYRN